VIGNFLIGLREGLEATLVVTILVAYLVKTGQRGRLGPIWAGVGAAVALSLGFGALLTYTSSQLSFRAQEAFGGTLSIVAVGFVTWMVFWMRRAARHLKTELHDRLAGALAVGATALVAVAFLAVGREGLETALFLWSNIEATGQSTRPILGAVLGLAAAVALGYLLYRRAVHLNLSRFFTWTGAALVVVAAGVLAYGVHDLQEAGILPGLMRKAFDVSTAIPPGSWDGTLLKGTVNVQPDPSVLQAVVWCLYLVPVMYLFFRPARLRSDPRPVSSPVKESTAHAPQHP
jgi:high-affinity iron transporter